MSSLEVGNSGRKRGGEKGGGKSLNKRRGHVGPTEIKVVSILRPVAKKSSVSLDQESPPQKRGKQYRGRAIMLSIGTSGLKEGN